MKSFNVITCEQRTPEWHAARLGRVTSSVVSEMLASRRDGKEAAGPRNLRIRLALERITGRSQDSTFVSKAMQQGVDREADALLEYEALTGTMVSKVGFLAHPELMAGASLDGYLGDYEMVIEVKSPEPPAHLEYLTTGALPSGYYQQIVHQCWITGAKSAEFVSFNPDFPDPLRLKVMRVVPREPDIDAHAASVRAFLAEVDRVVASIEALQKGAA